MTLVLRVACQLQLHSAFISISSSSNVKSWFQACSLKLCSQFRVDCTHTSVRSILFYSSTKKCCFPEVPRRPNESRLDLNKFSIMKISPEKLRRVSCLLKATWATWEKNQHKKKTNSFPTHITYSCTVSIKPRISDSKPSCWGGSPVACQTWMDIHRHRIVCYQACNFNWNTL